MHLIRAAQIPFVSEYPSFHEVSESSRQLIKKASEVIPLVRKTRLPVWMRLLGYDKSEIFTEALADLKGYLSDPLEETYRSYHGITAISGRSLKNSHTRNEMALLEHASIRLRACLLEQGPYHLRTFLESVSSELLGRKSQCRNKPVYLLRDHRGFYIEYLNSEQISLQIGVIDEILRDQALPALYRAILIHVLLVGAHPFEDGNGRAARLTFNAVLVYAGLGIDCYIPLREIFCLSTGALSIQTRRALLQNKWESVIRGFCEGVLVAWRVNDIVAHWTDEEMTSLTGKWDLCRDLHPCHK